MITYECTSCGSTNIVKNGKNRYGNQQFKCKKPSA
ncbi:MAG: IS1/IS1595 family N-terminal zinc-binding domain-containing protein [Trueperaceae bacterium]